MLAWLESARDADALLRRILATGDPLRLLERCGVRLRHLAYLLDSEPFVEPVARSIADGLHARDKDRPLEEWLDERIDAQIEAIVARDRESAGASTRGLATPHAFLTGTLGYEPDVAERVARAFNAFDATTRRVFYELMIGERSIADCQAAGLGSSEEMFACVRLAMTAVISEPLTNQRWSKRWNWAILLERLVANVSSVFSRARSIRWDVGMGGDRGRVAPWLLVCALAIAIAAALWTPPSTPIVAKTASAQPASGRSTSSLVQNSVSPEGELLRSTPQDPLKPRAPEPRPLEDDWKRSDVPAVPQTAGLRSIPDAAASTTQEPASTSLPKVDEAAARASEPTLSERAPLEPSAFHGRVVATGRRAIEGARISWTPLLDDLVAPNCGWDAQDSAAVERSSISSVSDSNGSFTFASPPEAAPRGSVMWITHPEHRAKALVLGADKDAWNSPALVELEPASPMVVRVLDEDGSPAPSAHVVQMAIVGETQRTSQPEVVARRVLHRVFDTDSTGRTRVDAFTSDQVIVASRGELVSEPWIGPSRRELTLTLRPVFHAYGKLHFDESSPIEGSFRVLCFVQRGSQVRALSVVQPDERGTWGPIALPVVDADAYGFRLEGGNVVPKLVLVSPPRAGERVDVDLEARAGIDVWFQVVSPSGDVLPEAQVTVRWDDNGQAMSNSARPGENGYTLVRGCRPGVVKYEACCPGFAMSTGQPMLLPGVAATWIIELAPAGLLNGRVAHGGNPVEDFEIVFWSTRERSLKVVRSFSGREEGAFEIDDAPLGDVSVCAMSSRFPRSETQHVTTTSSGPTEIVIELSDAVRAKGRVVDQATGEPIAAAGVQPFANEQRYPIVPWGPLHKVRSDGSFDVFGLGPGIGLLRVAAPSYSDSWVSTFAKDGEELDLGLISLPRKQPLTIRLVSDTAFDPTPYVLDGEGTEPVPLLRFSSEGVVEIDAISAGSYMLNLNKDGAEGQFLLQTQLVLEPGKEWRVELPVEGSRRLTVEVAATEDEVALPLTVFASLPSTNAVWLIRTLRDVSPRGVVTIDGLPEGEVEVSLGDATGTKLDSKSAVLAGPGSEARVRLGSPTQTYRFRVLDRKGITVPDATVSLNSVDNTKSWSSGTTDAQGEVAITGLVPGKYYNHITHQSLGEQLGKTVELGSDADEIIELVFDADASVQIRLVDGTTPQTGVPCRLFDESGRIHLALISTDDGGLARWPRVSEGQYRLKVTHTGYWPLEATIVAARDGGPQAVQIRRVGDLRVTVKNPAGLPVQGVGIELTSVEFGESVGAWAERGLIQASLLVSDQTGALRVSGIPHGDYRWRVQMQGVEVIEGQATVPAGAEARVTIVVP